MKPPLKSLADLKPATAAETYARPTPKVSRRKSAKVLTAAERAAFLASRPALAKDCAMADATPPRDERPMPRALRLKPAAQAARAPPPPQAPGAAGGACARVRSSAGWSHPPASHSMAHNMA